MRVKSKTSMLCHGVERKLNEEFEMSKQDAEAHQLAGLVEILSSTVSSEDSKKTEKK